MARIIGWQSGRVPGVKLSAEGCNNLKLSHTAHRHFYLNPIAHRTLASLVNLKNNMPNKSVQMEQITTVLEAAEAKTTAVVAMLDPSKQRFQRYFNNPVEFINPMDEQEFLNNVLGICYRGLIDIVQSPAEKTGSKLQAINMLLNRAKGPVKTEVDPAQENELLSKLIGIMDIDRDELTKRLKSKEKK